MRRFAGESNTCAVRVKVSIQGVENQFSSKDNGFLRRFITAKVSYSARTDLILFSLTYNPLTVSLSSAQLLNAERSSNRAADTIFKVFGMTQPSQSQLQPFLLTYPEGWLVLNRYNQVFYSLYSYLIAICMKFSSCSYRGSQFY